MELQSRELEPGVLGISLVGRMDSAGAQQIDVRFTALTATHKVQILVDLSQVTFLASIGIRTLVSNARAQQRRGGTMVLYQPIAIVEEVLKSSGIHTIIPIVHDMEGARKALSLS
jgi:anti-anti-sigma factor